MDYDFEPLAKCQSACPFFAPPNFFLKQFSILWVNSVLFSLLLFSLLVPYMVIVI